MARDGICFIGDWLGLKPVSLNYLRNGIIVVFVDTFNEQTDKSIVSNVEPILTIMEIYMEFPLTF